MFGTATLYASEVQHIGNGELKSLMQQDVPIIDVRTMSEWKKTGVIEGSHLIMFHDERGRYNLNKWLQKVAEVANKNEAVILICQTGGRSKQLAKYLTKAVGYENVYNVKRGIVSWIKQNNEVVTF